ncbi:PQQ-dependent sugar dehydrogenase [Paenibacillus sp. GCM10027627]|uniref:PQQ-dependent sugar dehydrogenase n=1 Tax=unclassified Paenibacillus TaxID=185978 RepID=UPI00363B75E6
MKNRQYMKLAAVAACTALLLSACEGKESGAVHPSNNANGEKGTAPQATASATAVQTESPASSSEPYQVLGTGLSIPWSIEFAGETIYLSEREGAIVRIEDGKLERETVQLSKAVHHEGEGGFLGLLLAPDFETTGQAYAYHTYLENGTVLNRVVVLKQAGKEWTEQKALLEEIPGDLYHNGGRMAFGTDGYLYVTTGDAMEEGRSQNRSSLAGKVLRMGLNGEVPENNPISGSYVFSYGHRNPQGLAWTADGTMYSTEHGPSGRPGGHDEINRLEPGLNYGWPLLIGDERGEGMTAPIYHTGDEAIAPSGTVADKEGRLVIAALRGEAIYRYTPETGKMEVLHKGEGRIRDVKLRDGKLYFITNNRDGRGAPTSADDRLIVMDYPA